MDRLNRTNNLDNMFKHMVKDPAHWDFLSTLKMGDTQETSENLTSLALANKNFEFLDFYFNKLNELSAAQKRMNAEPINPSLYSVIDLLNSRSTYLGKIMNSDPSSEILNFLYKHTTEDKIVECSLKEFFIINDFNYLKTLCKKWKKNPIFQKNIEGIIHKNLLDGYSIDPMFEKKGIEWLLKENFLKFEPKFLEKFNIDCLRGGREIVKVVAELLSNDTKALTQNIRVLSSWLDTSKNKNYDLIVKTLNNQEFQQEVIKNFDNLLLMQREKTGLIFLALKNNLSQCAEKLVNSPSYLKNVTTYDLLALRNFFVEFPFLNKMIENQSTMQKVNSFAQMLPMTQADKYEEVTYGKNRKNRELVTKFVLEIRPFSLSLENIDESKLFFKNFVSVAFQDFDGLHNKSHQELSDLFKSNNLEEKLMYYISTRSNKAIIKTL